jgi:uncharacterized protein
MSANRQFLPRIPGSKSDRANFAPPMIRTLTPRAELMLINLICFGPFAVRSVIELSDLKPVIVFDARRALLILGIELVAGTLAVLILRARGWTTADLGLRPSMPQTIGGMVLLIGSVLVIGSFNVVFVAITGTDPGAATTTTARVSWPLLVAVTLINPLYDEVFAVAYNVKALENSGPAFAITFSAAIRFICHLDQGPIAALTILPLGIIFAAVYWRWRLVWPLVVAHAVMDFQG